MSTFVCLHGAGGHAAYWDLVRAELTRRGHDSIAVDLPCDEEVGLTAYRDAVIDAIGDRDDVVIVAQSLAGLIAPLVADASPVEGIVLVTAMIPSPGESGGDWWKQTGHGEALGAQGLPEDADLFTQDVPLEVLQRFPEPRDQTDTLFEEPWPLPAWPDVPTRFLLCEDDLFFPPGWMADLVRARLGIEPEPIPGGHCAFLSHPVELAAALVDG
jgi:pimeloyl-ACP methyl ester carboxylesterase